MNKKEERRLGAVNIKVFCKFTCVCVLVYEVPKSSYPGIVLNFIEIHYQLYKKISLSISHNLLPGKVKPL